MLRYVLLFVFFTYTYAACPPAINAEGGDANFPPPDGNGNVVIGCVTEIQASKYSLCDITGTLTLPTCGSLTTIGNNAFDRAFDSNQEDLTIPDGVTTIGTQAFNSGFMGTRQKTGIKGTLTIPDSVTSIGANTFGYNQFDTIRIGSGITSMSLNAFAVDDADATTLQHVYVHDLADITSWHPTSKYKYLNFIGSTSYEVHIGSDDATMTCEQLFDKYTDDGCCTSHA